MIKKAEKVKKEGREERTSSEKQGVRGVKSTECEESRGNNCLFFSTFFIFLISFFLSPSFYFFISHFSTLLFCFYFILFFFFFLIFSQNVEAVLSRLADSPYTHPSADE